MCSGEWNGVEVVCDSGCGYILYMFGFSSVSHLQEWNEKGNFMFLIAFYWAWFMRKIWYFDNICSTWFTELSC